MKHKARGLLRTCTALILVFGILSGALYAFCERMPAAEKSLSLSMAEKLAFANKIGRASCRERVFSTV